MSEKTAKDPYDLIVNDSATLFLSPTLFSLYSAHAAKEPFCTGGEESSSYKFVPRMRSVPKSDKPNRRRGQRGGRPFAPRGARSIRHCTVCCNNCPKTVGENR